MQNKIMEITDKLKKQFEHLQKRQRMLVMILIGALIFSLYFNMVYKPSSSALRSARAQLASSNNELVKIKSQTPDIGKEREYLESARRALNLLRDRLAISEKGLPVQERVPQILGELVRQASGYSIDFASVKQMGSKDREGYPELSIEMKFTSNYNDLVNYLNRLDSVSPFLKVSDVRMEEMKENFGGALNMTITLTTLVGEGALEGKAAEPAEFAPPIEIERNPFASTLSFIKGKDEKEVKLHLSGIIPRGKYATAIINNDVYRVGDTIDGKTIKSILPNMVVLSDGRNSEVLSLKE